ncbi:MAG: SpoIIE family protein phosphatase [Acidimicrobiales bacterium]
MELTARYLAAESTLAVGGDWYECFTIDAGRVVLALGDVVGRGLEAAATVGQLRAAVAALANSVPGPGALLDRLDGFVRHFPGRSARPSCAWSWPSTPASSAMPAPGTRRRCWCGPTGPR